MLDHSWLWELGLSIPTVLVGTGGYENTIYHRCGGLNNRTASHSCGSWESEKRVPEWQAFWREPTSWFADNLLPAIFSHSWEKERLKPNRRRRRGSNWHGDQPPWPLSLHTLCVHPEAINTSLPPFLPVCICLTIKTKQKQLWLVTAPHHKPLNYNGYLIVKSLSHVQLFGPHEL